MPLAAGQTLTHYEILGPLGAGGMGEVYRAKDTRLEREVAIKVLPEDLADDEERLRRFEREAKTLALLNHPNVAGIHGVDQVGDVCFLALELVPGEDLAARLARGPLPVDEAVEVCRQIAEGLEAAHEAGVVHRDLKPANVRVTPEDIVKVLDFGLAKPVLAATSGDSGTTTAESDSFVMTQEGLVLGTPTYMSPEQARGKPVDRRTDIWAFGCVLYESLTGRRAFDGQTMSDVLAAILEREPDWSALPGNTPPRLRALIGRCLEKDPRRRLRDIGEARLQLEPGAVGEGVAVEERSSSRAIPSSLVGAAVGGALALALTWFSGDGEKTELRDLHISIPARAEYHNPSGPVISPDGTKVVFAALDEDGKRSLWLRSFDAFEASSIAGTDGADSPFWSPESDSIGFFRDGAIRILRLGEEVPRTLPVTERGRPGVWTSTGEIVYGGSEGPLHAVPATGGASRPVTHLDTAAGEFAHSLPTFLPDGDRFLYLGLMLNTNELPDEVREHRLCVGSLSSSESAVLRPFPSRPFYTERRELIYLDDGTVRTVPFDASTLEFTGEARTLAGGAAFFKPIGAGVLSVARNGSFAFQSSGYSKEMRWLDRGGIDLGRVGGSTSSTFGYRISPDGRHMAVGVTDPKNSLSDVWVLGLTRETKAQVTDGPFWEGEAVWTPDGRELFYAADTGGFPDIYKVSLEPATTPELVWERKGAQFPVDITDNGRTLLARDDTGFWELSLTGEGEPVLLVESERLGGRVSPDGSWLAYSSARSGQRQIYLLERSASRREFQITVDGGGSPRWDPRAGERHLFYLGQKNRVWSVDLSTEEKVAEPEPVILFETGKPIDHLEVMPDGERFLVRYDEQGDRPVSVVLRGVE